MAPFITTDDDVKFSTTPSLTKATATGARTLLLAPPSIASHGGSLQKIFAAHDRSVTDLQMLDRLSAGLVTIPDATYELILILLDADGTRAESSHFLGRHVFGILFKALKAGGKLQVQGGAFDQLSETEEQREAILAGLVTDGDSMVKPNYHSDGIVPLRLRTKRDKNMPSDSAGTSVALSASAKRKSMDVARSEPSGVGFVNFGDDFNDPANEEDDEGDLIDEDTLLTEEDLRRPVNIPPECAPRAGKRRRACKDCSCGLAEKLAAEDKAARKDADIQLQALRLEVDELAEVDFTIQGKIGSCGNCSLGDAFRCDGCPYIGMPAFKPGEEVRLLNNDVQL